MMNVWSWLADAVLALLLAATLVTSVRLDRALRVVRRDRAAFEALITNLGAATGSVKSGIQALRNEAERAAEQIERRSMEADKMATDLSFLIEAADRASAKLERGVQPAGAVPSTSQLAEAASAAVASAAAAAAADPVSRSRPGPAAKPAAGPRRSRAKAILKPAKEMPEMPVMPVMPEMPEMREMVENDAQPVLARTDGPDAGAAAGSALADLRELAGITTRRRSPRDDAAATGGTVIKLVG